MCCVVWCGVCVCVVCGVLYRTPRQCLLGCAPSALVEVYSHDRVQQRFVEQIFKVLPGQSSLSLCGVELQGFRLEQGSTACVELNIMVQVFSHHRVVPVPQTMEDLVKLIVAIPVRQILGAS